MSASPGRVDGVRCVVTGGGGFVGCRLVEMLLERGASTVVSFDIFHRATDHIDDKRIKYIQSDISNFEKVCEAIEGSDCVWHLAALVGPFHEKKKYYDVNYIGTINVLNACRKLGVKKLVLSGTPSTRFDGNDIDGLSASQLTYPKKFLQLYAETKAMGEKAVLAANGENGLMTVSIAPHQVYGPKDSLFLPNLLTVAGQGRLRIFGNGMNKISMTYVDNYAHGLILGYNSLREGSPALGKFYIVTDGHYQYFWKVLNQIIVKLGFDDLYGKIKLPYFFLMILAYICNFLGILFRTKFRLNTFNVKMLVIHRWFSIEETSRDLNYRPIVSFEDGWKKTEEFFIKEWLPTTPFAKTSKNVKRD